MPPRALRPLRRLGVTRSARHACRAVGDYWPVGVSQHHREEVDAAPLHLPVRVGIPLRYIAAFK